MRRFRRFRLPIAAWVRWAVLAAACLYLVVRLADLALLGPLAVIAENEARLRAIDAINRIVLRRLEGNLSHDNLVVYEKDQQGRIAAYHVKTWSP